jgi:hypothetical protein
VVRTARTYTNLGQTTSQLDKLERRGARALGRAERSLERRRRELKRNAKGTQRRTDRQAHGFRLDAGELVNRVKSLV